MLPLVLLALSVPAAFVAGVVFHKYVIGEANAVAAEAKAIKEHVTATVSNLEIKLRGDAQAALGKASAAAQKL